jgi:dolichyl-phosphate-mannose--protein O-mannosyl transferase
MNCPLEEPLPILPSHSIYYYTGLFILVIILAILIFELWALNKHKPTVSKWFQHFSSRFKWFKFLIMGGLGILIIHWTNGFNILDKIKTSKGGKKSMH